MDGKSPLEHERFLESGRDREEDEHVEASCLCDRSYGRRQENKERGNWLWNGQSTIALIGVALAPSMLLRFSYMMYRHGPGYLVAYVLALAVIGFPLVYLELSLGQFSSSGVLTCWPIPVFKGIGAGMMSLAVPLAIEQGILGAWSMFYLYQTMRSSVKGTELPWSSNHTVIDNAPECAASRYLVYVPRPVKSCKSEEGPRVEYFYYGEPEGGVCWHENYPDQDGNTYREPVAVYDLDEALRLYESDTNGTLSKLITPKHPASVYFSCHVVKARVTEDDPVVFSPAVTVSSLLMWLLVLATLSVGVKCFGTVLNVTVPVVVLLLLFMLIRGVTLPGAYTAWPYLFTPSAELYQVRHFVGTAVQDVIFSLSCGIGVSITFASYNRYHNNYVRDGVLLVSVAVVFRLITAMFVMSMIGFQAQVDNVSVNSLMTGGWELIYVVLSSVFQNLPRGTGWCAAFFTCFLLLNFHQMVGLVEVVITGVVDQFPRLRRLRYVVVIVSSVLFFLLALPMCTSDVFQWFNMVDWNILFYQAYLVVGLMIICYIVYGVLTYFWYRHDVAAMTGWDCCCVPSIVCWAYVTCGGLVITIIVVVLLALEHSINVGSAILAMDVVPSWANKYFQSAIRAFTPVVIVVVFLLQLVVSLVWKKPSIRDLFSRIWKPALPQHVPRVTKYRAGNSYSTQNYKTGPQMVAMATAPVATRPATPPPPYPGEGPENDNTRL